MATDMTAVFLVVLMLVTGSINTIVTKYMDLACASGDASYPIDQCSADNSCDKAYLGYHLFDHPFAQAIVMFIGEFLCLIVYRFNKARQSRDVTAEKVNDMWNPLILAIPALCDCTATSAMYLGLTLTYASQYQMLRGSLILFTKALEYFILKEKVHRYELVGMAFVVIGLLCVGAAALLSKNTGDAAPNPILGDIIIICAQLIVATQMVYEKKFIDKYQIPPLQMVGWEGVFGLGFMSFMCLVFYQIPGPRMGSFENINDAVLQLSNSHVIQLCVIGSILSIAFFNYSGISISGKFGPATRTIVDTLRTIVIWGYSITVGWEQPVYLQFIGFFFLLCGTFIYKDLFIAPFLRKHGYLAPSEPQVRQLDADFESTSLLARTKVSKK